MRNSIILALIVCLSFQAYSQTSIKVYRVKGTIIDSVSLKSIPFSTIALIETSENKIVSQTAADDKGYFEFSVSTSGEYIIKISSMGYTGVERLLQLKGTDFDYDLGKILVSESVTEIGTVDVTEQKKIITVEADKISYNTEADPDSKTSTALEILRRVPLVTVDGDDKIQLKGNSNFKVFLNGKPSTMVTNNPSDFLKSFPASSVKNIEVITSPGAKYDAEGVGGIINIVTSKKLIKGYTCTVRAGIDNMVWGNSGVYYATTLNKFAFSLNLNGNFNRQKPMETKSDRENFFSEMQKNIHTEGTNKNQGISSWSSGEFSYEIDTLNLISASVNFWGGRYQWEQIYSTQVFTNQNTINQEYKSDYSSKGLYGMPEGNLDYQHTFKRNPAEMFTLSYKFDLSPDNDKATQIIEPITNFFKSNSVVEKSERNNSHTFQVDYVRPIKKIGNLELGLKDILRLNSSNSNGKMYDFENFVYYDDPSKTIDFDYTQNIIAGYISFSGKLKKIGYKAGMRIENSETKGIFHSSENSDFKNNNFEYVPSASLSFQINDKNSVQLAYTKRIQRPGIWYLNPYIDNINPQYVSYGNPKLTPEHFHSVDFSYNVFLETGNINLSTYYSFSNDGIDRVIWTNNMDIVYSTYDNLLKKESFGGSINLNQNIKQKLNFNISFSANYNNLENKKDSEHNLSAWGFNGYGRLQYNLLKTWKVSAFGGYYQSPEGLQIKYSAWYYYGVSLTKEFFDKKLSISVRANNVLRDKMVWKYESKSSSFNQVYKSERDARTYGINISYRFGQMNGQVKRAQRSIINDDLKQGESKGGEN